MDRLASSKTLITRGGAIYVALLLAVVAAARLGLISGAGEVRSEGAFGHPYGFAMAVSGFLLAACLGTGSAVAGVVTGRAWLGLALLAAGGAVALFASEIAPAILYPDDRYPVAFGWTVGGVPVAGVTWLAATLGARFAELGTSDVGGIAPAG